MKKKIFKIILIFGIIFIIFNVLILALIEERQKNIFLKEYYKEIEYGESYDPKLDELIDLTKFNFIDSSKVIIKSNIKNEENKNYGVVGTYQITVLYKNINLVQDVRILDTIAPDLYIQDTIEMEYNTNLTTFDFKQFITASDRSKLKEPEINFSKVDSSKSGEYDANISIEDIYGNKTEKTFKIIIVKKQEETAQVANNVVENPKEKNTTTIKSNNKNINIKEKTNTNKKENTQVLTNSNNKEDTKEPIKQESKVEETKEKPKCNHAGQYCYDSEEAAIAFYKNTLKEYDEKLENGTIKTYEEYVKVCPYGYETMKCPYCEKWKISFYVGGE